MTNANEEESIRISMEQLFARPDADDSLSALSAIEKDVLRLRFGVVETDKLSFEEISVLYRIPIEHVQKLQAEALRKLKQTPASGTNA